MVVCALPPSVPQHQPQVLHRRAGRAFVFFEPDSTPTRIARYGVDDHGVVGWHQARVDQRFEQRHRAGGVAAGVAPVPDARITLRPLKPTLSRALDIAHRARLHVSIAPVCPAWRQCRQWQRPPRAYHAGVWKCRMVSGNEVFVCKASKNWPAPPSTAATKVSPSCCLTTAHYRRGLHMACMVTAKSWAAASSAPTLAESIGMAAEVAHGSCTDLPPVRK